MDAQLKGRLIGVVGFLLMVGCVAFNWYLLIDEGYFYPKISGLGPVVAMFGLMAVMFPSMARTRPNLGDRKSILITLIAGVIGLVFGGINFYLMSNYRR